MKTDVPNVSPRSDAVPQAACVTRPPLPQRMSLRVGSVSLRGFGPDAGNRFHHALQQAMMQGIRQRRELSFSGNIQLDRISIPPLGAGATVEDAARQVASGLLRTLEARVSKGNVKGREESARG